MMPTPLSTTVRLAPFPVGHRVWKPLPALACAVYRFFTAEGVLLYVGIAGNPPARWEHHRREAAWWADAATVIVDIYDLERTALQVERYWIGAAHPIHNVRSKT